MKNHRVYMLALSVFVCLAGNATAAAPRPTQAAGAAQTSTAPTTPVRKKRVAVFDFDYATVHSGVSAIFGQDVDIGKGISDLLVTYLVKDGSYSVIERKAIGQDSG